MNDNNPLNNDSLRRRLKELDEIRKSQGIKKPNFSELNSSNNSNSSKELNNNSNLKNSKTINHTQNLDNLNSQKINDNNSLDLENLNSNNSNSTNSQNSNNKNTSSLKDEISDGNQTESNLDKSKILKRDYDKEPLLIKDYTLIVFRLFVFFCFVLIFIFVITKESQLSRDKAPLGIIIILIFYAKEIFLTANNRFIEFKNSYINYYVGGILEKRVRLYEIENLYQNSSFQYKYLKERQMVMFIYLYILIVCVIYPNYIPLFALGAILFLCPKFYYQMKFGGNIKFYSSLLIETKENQINICIVDKETQKEIREYFLERKKVDIEKIDRIIYPF